MEHLRNSVLTVLKITVILHDLNYQLNYDNSNKNIQNIY